MAKIKFPPSRVSLSFDGKEYRAGRGGIAVVPDEAIPVLVETHGFELLSEAGAAEAEAPPDPAPAGGSGTGGPAGEGDPK